jgi:hypothetical protein
VGIARAAEVRLKGGTAVRHPLEAPPKKLFPNHDMKTKTKDACGRWKSGNPKPGFPLSHRPDKTAAQGKEQVVPPLWRCDRKGNTTSIRGTDFRIIGVGNESCFQDHSWIGICSRASPRFRQVRLVAIHFRRVL